MDEGATAAGGGEMLHADVLVVGGGMVGLVAAAAFAAGGLEVAVVDREAPDAQLAPGFDGRTVALAASSRRMLQALGLWEEIAPAACPILDIRVVDGASPLFVHYDHAAVGDEPFGHIVENREMRRALLATVPGRPGVRLLAPARLASLERGPARVEATVEHGGGAARRIRARLAVAADGRFSRLREDAGIGTTAWRYPQQAIVVTALHERPHRHVAHERFLPAGPFAILPMVDTADGRHRSSIVWTERARLVPRLAELDDDAFAAELRRRFGGQYGEVRPAGRRHVHPLGLSIADAFTALRLALVGDAATAIHPISGQGLNLGLRGVAALAEAAVDAHRLGLDPGAADVLERYAGWRHADVLALAATTDLLNRLFSNDLPGVRLARRLGLGAVERMPFLKQVFMRHAMGTLGDLPRLARGEPI